MVTTFSARLLHLASRCNPIVGQKRKRHDAAASANSPEMSAAKRSSGYYYAVTHADDDDDDAAASNKRRRQGRRELQYAAATIQRALTNAGRPQMMSIMARNRRERALPTGSVDAGGAQVVTSAEFDAMDNNSDESGDASQQESGVRTRGADEPKNEDQAASRSNDDENQAVDEYDVSSMYMLSGLIRSTRQYYSFSNESSDATATTASASTSNDASSGIVNYRPVRNGNKEAARAYDSAYSNDEKLSEDNSEGLSSWAPSSLSRHSPRDRDGRKDVDDDNRSDGQSSDMGAGAATAEGDDDASSSDGNSITSSESRGAKGSDDDDDDDGDEDYNDDGPESRRESYASVVDGPFTIVG